MKKISHKDFKWQTLCLFTKHTHKQRDKYKKEREKKKLYGKKMNSKINGISILSKKELHQHNLYLQEIFIERLCS